MKNPMDYVCGKVSEHLSKGEKIPFRYRFALRTYWWITMPHIEIKGLWVRHKIRKLEKKLGCKIWD